MHIYLVRRSGQIEISSCMRLIEFLDFAIRCLDTVTEYWVRKKLFFQTLIAFPGLVFSCTSDAH